MAGVVADFDCATPGKQQQLPWSDLNPPFSQGDDLMAAYHQHGDGLVNRDITQRLWLQAMEYTHTAEGDVLGVGGEVREKMGADSRQNRAYSLPGIRCVVILIIG
jgi:hypothetical protein